MRQIEKSILFIYINFAPDYSTIRKQHYLNINYLTKQNLCNMKKITKNLLTLALLLLGVTSVNAKETVIGSIDYSTPGATVGWNQIPSDATISIKNGCLVIDNNQSNSGDNYSLQLHILNGLALESGLNYKVNITYKVVTEQANPTVTVALWGDWNNGAPKYGTPIEVTNDFTTLNLSFENITFNSGGGAIMWQSRSVLGTIYISKVEVIEIAPDAAPEDEPMYDTTVPDGFENLIANGTLEGEGLANFRVNDYVVGENDEIVKRATAEPRVIVDPTDENNHIIVVTSNDGAKNDYDAQLFVTLPENQHFNLGDVIRLRMRVKADAKQGAASQFHNAPGAYVYHTGPGTINFKTVWTNYDSGDKEITSAMLNDNGNGPSRTIAFNLSVVDGEANNFYFDEIQLLVKRAPVVETWVDLLADADKDKTFFKTEEGVGGPWAVSPDNDGVCSVQSGAYKWTDWDTQFFVRLPNKLASGTQYKVSFKYQATKNGDSGTQGHFEPAQYKHYSFIGSPKFTTEWQDYEAEGSIDNNLDGVYTIAFNLSLNAVETTFNFKEFKFEVPEGTVLENSPEVPDYLFKPESATFTQAIDGFATMVPEYSMDISGNENIEAYKVSYDAENGCVALESTTELMSARAILVKANAGDYTDGITMKRVDNAGNGLKNGDNDNTKGDGKTMYVLANGDKGIGFYLLANGIGVPKGKGYLVIEVAEGGREFIGFADDATTIKTVENLKKSGVIYNLAGQQVKNAKKGLYIIDGKKAIVK